MEETAKLYSLPDSSVPRERGGVEREERPQSYSFTEGVNKMSPDMEATDDSWDGGAQSFSWDRGDSHKRKARRGGDWQSQPSPVLPTDPECTFRPRIKNLPSMYTSSSLTNNDFLTRNQAWSHRRQSKLDSAKREAEQQEEGDCTFTPTACALSKVLNSMVTSTSSSGGSSKLHEKNVSRKTLQLTADMRRQEEQRFKDDCTFTPQLNKNSLKIMSSPAASNRTSERGIPHATVHTHTHTYTHTHNTHTQTQTHTHTQTHTQTHTHTHTHTRIHTHTHTHTYTYRCVAPLVHGRLWRNAPFVPRLIRSRRQWKQRRYTCIITHKYTKSRKHTHGNAYRHM
jgi:hypothetical protein